MVNPAESVTLIGMPPTHPPLAPLPFGEASAKSFNDVASCTDFLGQLPGKPSRFDAIGREADFRIRFRPVTLPDVTLFAGTSSAKTVDHNSGRVAVVIPFGDCASTIRAGKKEYRWAAPHHAFFIPAGAHIEAEGTRGAFLRLDIEAPLLARTAAGMAGVDDTVLRVVAMMLQPEALLAEPGDATQARPRSQPAPHGGSARDREGHRARLRHLPHGDVHPRLHPPLRRTAIGDTAESQRTTLTGE